MKFNKEEQEEIDSLKKGVAVPKKQIVTNKAGYTFEKTSNRGFSRMLAKRRLTKLYGGSCCICGQWPDYKIIYNLEGAKRLERYCQTCYDKVKLK